MEESGIKWRRMVESGLLNFYESGNWDRAVRKPPSPHPSISAPLSTTSPHQSPISPNAPTPASLPHSIIIPFPFHITVWKNIYCYDASPISIVHFIANSPTSLISLLLSQPICFPYHDMEKLCRRPNCIPSTALTVHQIICSSPQKWCHTPYIASNSRF